MIGNTRKRLPRSSDNLYYMLCSQLSVFCLKVTHAVSELELAYRECDIPFIIITGTNGKTTTTALTQHILSKKLKTEACGNIGTPPCIVADENLDYFVCDGRVHGCNFLTITYVIITYV